MEGWLFKEMSWSTAVAKSPVRKLVLAGLLLLAVATVESQRLQGQLNIHEDAPEAGGAGSVATAARSIVGNPAREKTEQNGGNGARGLHLAETCVEYSAIARYCCGASGKGDCEAAGGVYSGPANPCEVVKVDVSAGPLMCTGLSNASGLLVHCPCGEDPGLLPAPILATPAPTVTTPAPTVTTPAPIVTTSAPVETTPAPTVTSPAPTVTSPAPTMTSPAPTVATPAPSGRAEATRAPVAASTPNTLAPSFAATIGPIQAENVAARGDLNAGYGRSAPPLVLAAATGAAVVGAYLASVLLW